jgi:streptogramin lyase
MRPWVLLVAVVACDGGSSPGPPSACPGAQALWIGSDYSSSAVGSLAASGAVTSVVGRVDLGADPALSVSAGRAFYVARDQDAIFELDACGNPEQRFSAHVSSPSGGGSDPYGVAVASDGSLWIPLYLVPSVLVLAPDGGVSRTVDLSGYDSDGNPDASSITIVDTPAGEKAFVTLDRLNPYPQSVQASWMLRIDTASGQVEETIVLAGRNPFTVTQDGSTLWLADPGNFDDATEPDAGIERFDTSTSTTSLLVREAQLGGSVAEIAVSGACGSAIVADATAVNATSLATFDPTRGQVLLGAGRSPLTTAGFDLQGLTWASGTLLLGDRRRAATGYPVHAFTASAACALQQRPDAIFLPSPPVTLRPVP